MEQHKHCKICNEVIEEPKVGAMNYYRQCAIFDKLEKCENCIFEEALNRLKKSKS